MKQGEKITIIWDEHEPPKNYIWVHGGKAYEHNGQEWVESEYDVANFRLGNTIKREIVCDDNTIQPDNIVWLKDGDFLVNDGGDNWKDVFGTKINTWAIVDHTNFAEACDDELADYYTNFPSQATADGTEWPAAAPTSFPWFVVNHAFDGDTTFHVYMNNKEIFSFKPAAQIECEDASLVDTTYCIVSVPNELELTDYTESSEGTDTLMNPSEFKVYLT